MTDLLMTASDVFEPSETQGTAFKWIGDQAAALAKYFDIDQEDAVMGIGQFAEDTEAQAATILSRKDAERSLDHDKFDLPDLPPQEPAPAEVPAPAESPYGFLANELEHPDPEPVTAAPTVQIAANLFNRLDRQKMDEQTAQTQQAPAKPAAKSAATSDKSGKLVGLTVAVVAAALLLIGGLKLLVGGKEEAPQQEISSDTKKLLEDRKNYNQRDIRNMQGRKAPVAPLDNPLPTTAQEPAQPAPQAAQESYTPQRPKTGKGANYRKDKDIIEQYKEVNPGAAAVEGTAPAANPEVNSLRYRPRPFSAGSTGDNRGGIHITGRDTGPQKTNTIQLHNTQLKSRLKFSIRSSASNSITAESTQDLEGIPAGSIFYGSGSFSNKRTYVQFSRVRIGDTEYEVKAYAISGKDPGIPSEVIEIENNAKITFTSGVMDATGKVLDNLVSTATGGAGSGVVNNTTGDVKEKNEQQRARYEYRVGAGTTFTIYIE